MLNHDRFQQVAYRTDMRLADNWSHSICNYKHVKSKNENLSENILLRSTRCDSHVSPLPCIWTNICINHYTFDWMRKCSNPDLDRLLICWTFGRTWCNFHLNKESVNGIWICITESITFYIRNIFYVINRSRDLFNWNWLPWNWQRSFAFVWLPKWGQHALGTHTSSF